MIEWVRKKLVAVRLNYDDLSRRLRDRYSALYPHGVLWRIYLRYPSYRGIKVFIETGTFMGKTAIQESRYFRDVHTIELNEQLFEGNKSTFKSYKNIYAYKGDTVDVLPDILRRIDEPCVFFLDAHWSGDQSVDWGSSEWKGYGVNTSFRGSQWPPVADQQCPLIEEARLIQQYSYPCVIIVDDWEVAGTKNVKFEGEDWSSISLDRLLEIFTVERLLAHRIVSYKGKQRLVILLRSGGKLKA